MNAASGAVLDAVHEAESAIRPAIEACLEDAVDSADAVGEELRTWNGGNGQDDVEAAINRAAIREANRLTNVVRYRVVTGSEPPPPPHGPPLFPLRDLDAPDEVDATLDELHTALQNTDGIDISAIGARYETVLSDGERRSRGQFYTPPAVAEAVVRWAVDGAGDRPCILDPAVGTGTFPLAVSDVLAERDPAVEPKDRCDRLVGVDVDGSALYLAALRLSARFDGASVDWFDRLGRSFFELEPGTPGGLGRFDVVVGNPPFVRAGDLAPDRDHYRDHLADLGPPGETPYVDGERALSGRSDASIYFVTQATRFLRPGGRLGMVLPAKWLESRYGTGFRHFLDDHYRVHAVAGFDARAFDALVDTVVLLAERRPTETARDDENPVQFVRLDGDERVTDALDSIRSGRSPAEVDPSQASSSRFVERSQSTFAEARQCSPFLRAPEELIDLLEHPAFVPLGELASVRRGVTTGANRFFLLDRDRRERWGIDPAVLRPAVRSIRGLERRTLVPEVVDRWILDVREVVASDGSLAENGIDPEKRAKAALRRAGHNGLVEYVEHAEDEGWHEGRTCQARRVWFDLGELPVPDAFVPKLLRERVFTVRNRAAAVPSNAIDCLSVRDGIDTAVLLGVLDSSLSRAVMEVWGRDEAGMLQLMTDETRTLPVPDVRRFSGDEAARVRTAASELDADRGDRTASGQSDLDEAVVDAAGLDFDAGRLRALRDDLLRRRVDGGERNDVPTS